MTLSLGIDIGTSGIRTAVLDADGTLVSMARADHLPQDPDRIEASKWWEATCLCITRQIAALAEVGRDGSEITRIAIDGTSGSMVLTDEALAPVTRALMYNSKGFDDEAAAIATHAPPAHITRGSNSALARAMRLASEDEESRARHLMHQADFVAARLIGRGGLSDHNNALKTGFDPETGEWPDWIGEAIDPSVLPDPRPTGTPLDHVSREVAARLGISPDATVHAGTTDSIAAFIAAAPLRSGTAVTSLGSTLAVKSLSPARIDDAEIGLYSHRLGPVWLAGGASNTGGAVLAHFFTADALADLSRHIDPNAPSGLDYYPLLSPGERFPFNDPSFPPRIDPRPTSDALFLQGLLEGIAQIEARCYGALAERGGRFPDVIYSAGGGAANAVFTHIRARALGLVPEPAPHGEAAIGAAKLAGGFALQDIAV
ncbi:MAG: FGGY-family carbohydrate kinase [Pseudomonadota bacterium]